MENNSVVTILLATYNGEKYVQALLDSLEKQLYTEWDLIVLDDCSTDSTVEIIKRYSNNTKHAVTIYVNEINRGEGKGNFIDLMQLCKSNYAFLCDQDDVWESDKILEMMTMMNKIEKYMDENIPIMIHSDMSVVDGELNVIDASYYHYAKYPKSGSLKLHLCMNEIPGCSMMINKALITLCSVEIDPQKIIMHDSWIALIAYVFGTVYFIDKPLVKYRQHKKNSLGAANARKLNYKISKMFDRKRMKLENRQHVSEVSYFMSIYSSYINDPYIKMMLNEYSNLLEKEYNSYIYVCIKYRILKYPVSRAVFQLVSGCNF